MCTFHMHNMWNAHISRPQREMLTFHSLPVKCAHFTRTHIPSNIYIYSWVNEPNNPDKIASKANTGGSFYSWSPPSPKKIPEKNPRKKCAFHTFENSPKIYPKKVANHQKYTFVKGFQMTMEVMWRLLVPPWRSLAAFFNPTNSGWDLLVIDISPIDLVWLKTVNMHYHNTAGAQHIFKYDTYCLWRGG